nr:ribosomal protein S18-alanine N-acetyltransferase [uncultured Eisenbergiella sp.]
MMIRRMVRDDLTQAASLEQKCFGTDAWSLQAFADALEDANALYLSGMEEGTLVAYCGIWKSFEDGDITNVAVEEIHRKKGYARQLLKQLMKEASLSGVENFTLEVRESNLPAIRLYESLGFVTEGVRKDFYRNPKENALIMWKR